MASFSNVGSASYSSVVDSWFLWRPENRGDMLPWLLVITAESILVLHGLAAMWTILVGYRDRRDWTYYAT